MVNPEAQTPVEGQQEIAQAEVESPPSDATPGVVQPEAGEQKDEKAPEPVKTYTQEEVSKIQSGRDQEIASLRAEAAQTQLHRQIERTEQVEAQYASQDSIAVESGDMTQEVATQRKTQRREAVVTELQTQQTRVQDTATHQAMVADMMRLGRMRASEDFGKEYGVDPKTLFDDTSLSGPDAMEAKAAKLALEKARAEKPGTESFDSGQIASSGASIANMSPEQKIAYGLRQKIKSR